MHGYVRSDGEYPHDFNWKCAAGHTHSVWERSAVITHAAAMVLLGAPAHMQLINKAFAVYASDYTWAYAVYNHDGNYSILQTRVRSIVERFRDRKLGVGIPGIMDDRGNFGLSMMSIIMPAEVTVKAQQECPDTRY